MGGFFRCIKAVYSPTLSLTCGESLHYWHCGSNAFHKEAFVHHRPGANFWQTTASECSLQSFKQRTCGFFGLFTLDRLNTYTARLWALHTLRFTPMRRDVVLGSLEGCLFVTMFSLFVWLTSAEVGATGVTLQASSWLTQCTPLYSKS